MPTTLNTKQILFIDNTTLNYIFGSGNSYRPDFGTNYLNQLAKTYDIKVTNVILSEAIKNSGYGGVNGVFENWMLNNSIDPITTTQAPGDNAGELSIIEASKQPEFAGKDFKIASDDTKFFNPTGSGKDYVSKTLQIQGLSGDLLKSGGLNITDYNDLATKYAGLNSSRDWVPEWLTKPQQFNETPYAREYKDYGTANRHVADEAGVITDTKTGVKYNVSEVFKNLLTNQSGGTGTITDLANYLKTDATTLEHAIVNGAAKALAAIGVAAMIADIANDNEFLVKAA